MNLLSSMILFYFSSPSSVQNMLKESHHGQIMLISPFFHDFGGKCPVMSIHIIFDTVILTQGLNNKFQNGGEQSLQCFGCNFASMPLISCTPLQ